MLYNRYTKTNLVKDYNNFTKAKLNRYNAICELKFNKKTREFVINGYKVDNYKEILDEILRTHDEHLENENEKIIIFRPYEDMLSVNNFLEGVIEQIYKRQKILNRFVGQDPAGYNWLIPGPINVTDRMYKILLEEKRQGTKFNKREKRVLNELDKIMYNSKEIENEEINMEELNLLKQQYNEIYDMVTQLTKEMSLLKEQLANKPTKSKRDHSDKMETLKPIVLVNELKAYENYNQIKEDIESNLLEIQNIYNLLDIEKGTRYNIGRVGNKKAFWMSKEKFDELSEKEKQAYKFMADNELVTCVYSNEIENGFFATVEDAAKYCDENDYEFTKIAYIKENIIGKRRFACISPEGVACTWRKISYKYLNKKEEEGA